MFDKHGNGSIFVAEFRQILKTNNSLSNKCINQIIKEVDHIGDGQISYKEFDDMMLKIL